MRTDITIYDGEWRVVEVPAHARAEADRIFGARDCGPRDGAQPYFTARSQAGLVMLCLGLPVRARGEGLPASHPLVA